MPEREGLQGHDVDAVVESTRELGALIARSLSVVEPTITMPQWRVVVLASQGPCNLSTIATDLRIHPSNATRLCDRLAGHGLVERTRSEHDGRQVLVSLTEAGWRFHEAAMEVRRDAVRRAMALMSTEDRSALVASLPVLADALASVRDAPEQPA